MDSKRATRRLKLMNEVLPDPTPQGPGSPRQRTMQHLQKLLAVAASGATAAGCSNNPTQKPTEPTVEIPGTSVSVNSTPSGSAIATQLPPKASASQEPEPPGVGYGVVDPMPPPARCPGLSQTIAATATWKQDG